MRVFIFFFIASLFLISCGQDENKEKELDLRERELALKEKELSLKYGDSSSQTSIKVDTRTATPNDTPKPIPILEIEKKTDLPFIGKKMFNMDGGSGTARSITITKDNLVIIRGIPSPEASNDGAKGEIEFKGTYKPVIVTNDGYRYKIEANKISLVNKKGEIERGCGSGGIQANEPCTTDFY